MADDVTRRRAIVAQQSLHGYADGHREIASSAQLVTSDARTMLAMSDLASVGTRLPEGGYLTGYPLSESQHYAIARTWSAPEMPRPGCVWTHTLLIPLADVEAVVDGQDILAAFRRPNSVAPSAYASPVSIDLVATQAPILPSTAENWIRPILFALYGRPSEAIVATAPPGQNVEAAVLALWLQQPIEIRKRFAFCTSTTADRSSDRLRFDLQIAPATDRSTRAQFPGATLVSTLGGDAPTAWVDSMIADLRDPARVLSRNLRGLTNRAGVVSALWVWQLVGNISERPAALSEALALLRESPSMASAVPLSRIAAAVAPQAMQLDSEGLTFLFDQLPNFEAEQKAAHGATIAHVAWLRAPERLTDDVFGDPALARAVLTAGSALSLDEILNALIQNPGLAAIALSIDASILAEPRFWTCSAAAAPATTMCLAQSSALWQSAISAAMESRTPEIVDDIVRIVGAEAVWHVLIPRLNSNCDYRELRPWIERAVADVAATTAVLAAGTIRSPSALSVVAEMLGPHAIRIDDGEDPWLIAVRHLAPPVELRDVLFLAPFLSARALGAQTKSRAELLALSFDAVYQAAATNVIDDDGWGLLERYLPEVPFWGRWDRCYRLRQIGTAFVERSITPTALITLTQDDRLFAEIVRLLAQSREGRRYLRRAKDSLLQEETADNEKLSLRAKIIEHNVW